MRPPPSSSSSSYDIVSTGFFCSKFTYITYLEIDETSHQQQINRKSKIYRFSNGTICAFLELYIQVKVFQQQNTEYWRTEKPGSVIITVKNVQHEVLYCSRILIESFDDKFIAVRGVIDGLFLEYSYFVLKLFQFFPSLLVLCFLSHFMRNV